MDPVSLPCLLLVLLLLLPPTTVVCVGGGIYRSSCARGVRTAPGSGMWAGCRQGQKQQPTPQSASGGHSSSGSSSRAPAPAAALQQRSPGCPSPGHQLIVGVGGAERGGLFTTNRATLEESQPQSILAALISGRHGPPRRDAKVRRGRKGKKGFEGGEASRSGKGQAKGALQSCIADAPLQWLLWFCVCSRL